MIVFKLSQSLRKYILLIGLMSLPVLLIGQEKKTLAILDLDAIGVSAQEAQVLTNRLRSNLVNLGVYQVIDRGLMEQILLEQDFQMTGCTSNECAVEVGRLLGAQLMLAGSIGKIGFLFSMELRIIDVQTGGIIRSVSQDIEGDISKVLTEGIPEAAQKIVAAEESPPSRPSPPAEVPAPIKTGILNITSTPEALLIIDGQEMGITPLASLELSVGSHMITLRQAGYETLDTSLVVVANRLAFLQVDLKPTFGLVSILSNPPGATVRIEGGIVGITPVDSLVLGAASQGVIIALNRYDIVDTILVANKDEVTTLLVDLKPRFGWLSLEGTPIDARVWVDGQEIGTAPLEQVPMDSGQYHLQISKELFRTLDTNITIAARQSIHFSYDLPPQVGNVSILSAPAGAKTVLNSRDIGVTPLSSQTLSAGVYQLKLSLEGYSTSDTTFTVIDGQNTFISLNLVSEYGRLTVKGTSGAEVQVDGRVLGLSPIISQRFHNGDYDLQATKIRYLPFQEQFHILSDKETTVLLEMQKKPIVPAVVLSTLLPGTGQFYLGKKVRGIVFLAAAAGAGSMAVIHHLGMLSSYDQYFYHREMYASATDFETMSTEKELALQSFDGMKAAEKNRNYMIGVFGVAWFINIVEVFF